MDKQNQVMSNGVNNQKKIVRIATIVAVVAALVLPGLSALAEDSANTSVKQQMELRRAEMERLREEQKQQMEANREAKKQEMEQKREEQKNFWKRGSNS